MIFLLIIMAATAVFAQSYRLLNPKIDLYGKNIDLRLNGQIGPPDELDDIEAVRLFFTSNNVSLLNRQLIATIPIEAYNMVDRDPELACLAQASYWESRGENFKDKVAVANVVMNRTKDPRFPKTTCKVVRDGCQFSWHCSGLGRVGIRVTENNFDDHKVRPWVDSVLAAVAVKNRLVYDPTNGATHFYAHRTVRPSWARPEYVTLKLQSHTYVRLPCKQC